MMLSLQDLESQLRTPDSIVLFISGKIICGCSKQLASLTSLAEHLTRCPSRLERKDQQEEEVEEEGNIQEHFR